MAGYSIRKFNAIVQNVPDTSVAGNSSSIGQKTDNQGIHWSSGSCVSRDHSSLAAVQ